jgi:hypothetical protein
MPMKMPKILDCTMSECSYNKDDQCHAITVGAASPLCDTFAAFAKKGGALDMTGSVGACKVDRCKFNDSLECAADGIHVGRHVDHPECDTFSQR